MKEKQKTKFVLLTGIILAITMVVMSTDLYTKIFFVCMGIFFAYLYSVVD